MLANRISPELGDKTHFVAAVSPHDEYAYAQRVYVHAFPCLKTRHVFLVGVAHKAREYPECEGRLVFEAFDAWRGPYGPVRISSLRQDLLRTLPRDAVQVQIRYCSALT